MAAKVQTVELFLRIEQKDENGNLTSKPLVVNKTINADMHTSTDHKVADGGTDADGLAVTTAAAHSDSSGGIVSPKLVCMLSPDGEDLTVTPGAAPLCNLYLAANFDDADLGIDTLTMVAADNTPDVDCYPRVLVSGEDA
jgi:hypothetical protein